MNNLSRKTFDKSASLGLLYDVRNDTIIPVSISNRTLPNDAIFTCDISSIEYICSLNDSLEEKFNYLNINAELRLSIMCGLLNIEGNSGKYLEEKKSNDKLIRGTIIYRIKTKNERLNLTNEELLKRVPAGILDRDDATHVISGINWGSNMIATFEYENKENLNKTDIEGSLKASLKKISNTIKGNGNLNYTESERNIMDKISIEFICDFINEDELPTNIEQAINFFKMAPQKIQNSNSGKGVVLEIELSPLKMLAALKGVDTQVQKIFVSIEEEIIYQVQDYLIKFTKLKQKISDLYQENNEKSEMINEIKYKEISFRSELSKLVVQIRSGNKEINELVTFLSKFKKEIILLEEIEDRFTNYNKMGIVLIGKSINLKKYLRDNHDKEIYILVYSEKLIQEDKDEIIDFFMNLCRNKKSAEKLFVIYDLDLFPNEKTSDDYKDISIIKYSKGKKELCNLLSKNPIRPYIESKELIILTIGDKETQFFFDFLLFEPSSEDVKKDIFEQICLMMISNKIMKLINKESVNYPLLHKINELNMKLIKAPEIQGNEDDIKIQDKVESTLSFLSNYEYLNSICIFLEHPIKFNRAKKTYLKKLFLNLHKNSINNIIFCINANKCKDTTAATILKKIQECLGSEVSFSQKNIFLFDTLDKEKDSHINMEFIEFLNEQINKLIQNIRQLPLHYINKTLSLAETNEHLTITLNMLEDIDCPIFKNEEKLKMLIEILADLIYMVKKNMIPGLESEIDEKLKSSIKEIRKVNQNRANTIEKLLKQHLENIKQNEEILLDLKDIKETIANLVVDFM